MNIAFQALLLFLLVLPGLIFQASYNGRLTKDSGLPLNFPSVTSRTIGALISAALLHAIWVPLANLVGRHFGFVINLHAVVFLLTGNYSDHRELDDAIRAITLQPYLILTYFVGISATSYWLGQFLHAIVRKMEWDIKYPLLRFNNEWHYLLWGEILQFPENDRNSRQSDGTVISAAVDSSRGSHLYIGVLVDYWFDRSGNLDKILLEHVYRRNLRRDRRRDDDNLPMSADPRYYPIDGDYLMLRYADIKNINIRYLYVQKESA